MLYIQNKKVVLSHNRMSDEEDKGKSTNHIGKDFHFFHPLHNKIISQRVMKGIISIFHRTRVKNVVVFIFHGVGEKVLFLDEIAVFLVHVIIVFHCLSFLSCPFPLDTLIIAQVEEKSKSLF